MSERPTIVVGGDPNLARKRVRVQSVVTLESRCESVKQGASFPGLVSFAKSTAPQQMEDVSMRLVKKHRVGNSGGDRVEGESPELIAQKAGEEWRASKGFTEMNHDYFIGVRNRETDVIHLFEVDGMYSLRPFVRRRQALHDEPAVGPEDKKRTYAEQKSELLRTFGGKRSLKKVERYEKDRITDDKVDEKAKVQVTQAAKEMREKDVAEGIHHLQESTTESMAPPHDSSATTREGAYPLEGLITPGELAALEQEALSMIESSSEATASPENPGWNTLVWETLIHLVKEKELSSAARIRRMQAAMHLHYLIVLSGCSKIINYSTQSKLMEDMAVDEGVWKCLLERFAVPHSSGMGKQVLWRKTQADSTRLIVYAIIMWVTACGFSNCDRLDGLAEALGVSVKLLLTHSLQIGCKVRRKQDQEGPKDYRLSLKVPLVFPPIRKRMGRPQKRS